MIPDIQPPSGRGGWRAERDLFDALRASLPDDFFVYRNVHYFDADRHLRGESDFLVLHRELGVLSIECKGKGVRRNSRRIWVRQDGDAEKPIEDPYMQSERNCENLVKKLHGKVAEVLPSHSRLPLIHGHCVAFPRTLVSDLNLHDSPRELTIDAADLGNLEEKVREIYEIWQRVARKGRRISEVQPWEFKKLRKKVFQPQLNFMPTLGGELTINESLLCRLSREQRWVIDALAANQKMQVKGGAGTGKTILAAELARRLAYQGKRVLFVCYTRRLGYQLEKSFEGVDLESGLVDALGFHQLCRRAFKLLGWDWAVPEEDSEKQSFWRYKVPGALHDAVEAGLLGPWDALIVDEGQDFRSFWWDVLSGALNQAEDGRVIVFHDPDQNLFVSSDESDAAPPYAAYPVIPLTRNFRNTKRIAETVKLLCAGAADPHPGAPLGVEPVVALQATGREFRKQMDSLIRRLVEREQVRPESIAILTPHTRGNSSLAKVDELGGLALSEDFTARKGALLHSTISGFKGLESDVIILLDIDPDDIRCGLKARYVAASRAKSFLYVFTFGDWLEGTGR